MVRFWGYPAQASVAQRGSSLSVVAVCDRTWASAPLPRPELQVEIELPLLHYPGGGPGPSQRGGLQPRKLRAATWLQRCTGPAPGPPSRVSQGAGPQAGPGRLALRAAVLGRGALCLATRAPHVAK